MSNPKACIECFQNIPCNPCQSACPRGAITVGDDITALPVLDPLLCNGCGLCITRCPGLAIFVVDETFSPTTGLVSFPYEYHPLPVEGATVTCLNRMGAPITTGVVHKVRSAPSFDHTAIVTVEIPTSFVAETRFIDRKELPS